MCQAERVANAVQKAALALHAAADLPSVLSEVGEIVGETGLALSQLQIDLVDEQAMRLESYAVLTTAPCWDDEAVDAAPKIEAFLHQRTQRWTAQQLDGEYALMAVPTSEGVICAAVVGQEPVAADLEEFLHTVAASLQLLVLRARDLQRKDDATRALKQATADLSQALVRIQREVQERRQAEKETGRAQQLLERVIGSSPAAIYSCKVEHGFPITFVSDNVTALSGFTPLEIIGNARLWLSRIHRDDIARFIDNTSNFLETGNQVCEYRIHDKNGDTRWIHDEMRLVRARGPRPEIMGSWLDITERVQLDEGRRQVELELESQRALNMRSDRLRSLGEMAAGIAHELNQPLVGVRGKAEHILLGLERGWDLSPQTLRDRVAGIVEQADRMQHIVEHVRMFAREAGKPKTAPVDVNEIVNSATELLGAQLRSHGVYLTTELAPELPLVVANSYSLEEVLLNLLTNARDAVDVVAARDATDQGVVHIATALQEGEAPRRVRIDVIDNGCGVPRDDLERVFEPFYTTKDPDKGTGLGLSVSKSIVEQMGGRIWMHCAPESVTTVSIVLTVSDIGVSEGPAVCDTSDSPLSRPPRISR